MWTFLLFHRSAYQLWVPESPDEGVCSLAMINAEFALHENEINLKSGLLFAGHFNGQISLVSGKGKRKFVLKFYQPVCRCKTLLISLSFTSIDSILVFNEKRRQNARWLIVAYTHVLGTKQSCVLATPIKRTFSFLELLQFTTQN